MTLRLANPQGEKKGKKKKQRTPIEHPDTARSIAYARVLIALGDGEVDPEISGKNILLDGTPILDENGSENMPGVKWEFRPGTPHQAHIAGMPVVENEIGLGVELRSTSPYVRSITNTQLSAVRFRFAWPQLQQYLGNGDQVGYKIEYTVDVATDGGGYQEVGRYSINDKVTSEYQRSHRIDLPTAESGWTVRVRRLTPNQTTSKIADKMYISSISEVIDAKLRYPNTALLFVEFDSAYFSGSVPTVSVRKKWKIVRVPSNYNPNTRTYSGVWDGSFKWAWTNNPAWVWYDLVLDKRYGLGRRINASQVDKWAVYRIARYCDQLVPDGKGGEEPRHIFDCVFNTRTDAWTVLRDIASSFNGMTYWNGAQIVLDADMPREIDYVYTRADVKDGKFQYGAQKANTKHSMALISYSNPDNHYDQEVVPVSDENLIRRYGINQTEVTAIGCTRESEGMRRGKHLLLTNKHDRSISFATGLEGKIPLPGMVIGIADEGLAGRAIGGRISSAVGKEITLDREAQAKPGDRLILNLPSGKSEARTVSSMDGRTVTVTANYSETPHAQSVWAIDALELAIQQYRVLRVRRAGADSLEHSIEGIQYEPGKFDNVDYSARTDERPVTVRPPSTQPPPSGVTLDSYSIVEQGLAVTTLRAQWPQVEGAVAYEAAWRKDNGAWVNVPRTSGQSFEVPGVYSGRYIAQVRAVNAIDIASLPAFSAETAIAGKQGSPPLVAYLRATSLVFGIQLKWGFPEDGALDAQRTEIEYRKLGGNETLLGDFSYPTDTHTMIGLKSGQEFQFRARLHDRTGNVGPWSDWILGAASADAGDILDYLNGQITNSQLAQDLLAEIERIEGLGEQVTGLDGALTDAVGRLVADQNLIAGELETLGQQISEIVGSEEYNPEQAYLRGAIVKFEDAIYKARLDTPKHTPPASEAHWEKVGDYASLSDMLLDLAQQVTVTGSRIDEIDGVVTPMATQLSSLRASARRLDDWSDISDVVREWDSIAEFNEEVKVRASQYEALAQRITSLRVELDEDISASITLLAQTVARENQALSLRLDQQDSNLGDANSRINNTNQTLAQLDSAVATMRINLNAKYDQNTTAIDLERTTRASQIEAAGEQITIVRAGTTAADAKAVAAQNTADTAKSDAATAAGIANGKGETIIQPSTPTGAKRLAQNLWINTTGGKNTPMRWDGERWAEVTDKAAKDAAQAAVIADAKAVEAQKGVTANAAAIKNETTVRTTQFDSLGQQINTVQASVASLDLASELDPIFPNGKRMNTDPTFLSGVGGVLPYDNGQTGRVVVLRQSRAADNPSTSTHQLRVTITNGAYPGYGGFLIPVQSRANAVFLVKYVIKLPTRYTLETASNSMGTGYTDKFIGSSRGTGRYETYIRIIKCGASGAFDGGGHVYASGTGLTGTAVSYMYLSQVEIYDTTDFSGMTPEMTASIQTNSQAIANVDGTLKAQHTMRVQTNKSGKKVMTGIGLVADGQTGESSILMLANELALISSLNGVEVTPFAVDAGIAYLASAMIKEASITSAKLGTAAVDTLTIKGRAVTVPYSVVSDNEFRWDTGSEDWKEIQRINVLASGEECNINVFTEGYCTKNGFVWVSLRVLRNGNVIWIAGGGAGWMLSAGSSAYFALTVADTPPAGGNTYTLEIRRHNTYAEGEWLPRGIVKSRSLVYTEFKR